MRENCSIYLVKNIHQVKYEGRLHIPGQVLSTTYLLSFDSYECVDNGPEYGIVGYIEREKLNFKSWVMQSFSNFL
jgi:hypothetical protein